MTDIEKIVLRCVKNGIDNTFDISFETDYDPVYITRVLKRMTGKGIIVVDRIEKRTGKRFYSVGNVLVDDSPVIKQLDVIKNAFVDLLKKGNSTIKPLYEMFKKEKKTKVKSCVNTLRKNGTILSVGMDGLNAVYALNTSRRVEKEKREAVRKKHVPVDLFKPNVKHGRFEMDYGTRVIFDATRKAVEARRAAA